MIDLQLTSERISNKLRSKFNKNQKKLYDKTDYANTQMFSCT